MRTCRINSKINDLRMINALRKVIKADRIIPDQDKLVEENVMADGSPFIMETGIMSYRNVGYLSCCFDKGGLNTKEFPYFNDIEGYCKMCDYIVFAEDDERLFVFLVELKNSNSPIKQLDITETFAKFIIARMQLIEDNFDKDIYYRKIGVKLTHNGHQKRGTKGYEFCYDDNNYALLPDYRRFDLKYLMNP